MLSEEEFDAYLAALSPQQAANIRSIRSMILDQCPTLIEKVDDGKWFGGLLTYHLEGQIFAYALGPLSHGFTTFHMMPFYSSESLQSAYGQALKKFQSGKSCIKFMNFADLPQDAIKGILLSTEPYGEMARKMFAERKKRK